MRSTFKWLAYILAAEVLVQAMAIAYGLATLHHWVEEDGGKLTKAVSDSDAGFPGVGGFMIHGINGQMVIPLLVIILLVVSFFSKLPDASKRAGILLGLVALQVFLGIFSHALPVAIVLHALNAFGIFAMALFAGYRAGRDALEPSVPAGAATA